MLACKVETMGYECFELQVERRVAHLNALQPGIFSIEDIRRTVAAKGGAAEYADLPALG